MTANPANLSARPRIAIVGNMNNAGFAMLRYFRDLGADAWLIPFANPEPQFRPEWDTWEWEKWRKFFRPPLFPNTVEAVLGDPRRFRPPPAKAPIQAALADYDRVVGSGITPALFKRIGRRLDLFFPYSTGVEYYNSAGYREHVASSPLRRVLHGRVRRLQAQGIREARYCLNAELSLIRAALEEIGKPFIRLGLVALYNREDPAKAEITPRLRDTLDRMAKADLSLFGAARQMWVRPQFIAEADWPPHSKNNDWLIRGLAEFVGRRPEAKPLLTVVEYGRDVDATKRLVAELEMERFVQWLPVLPRREIMLLLGHSDIGVGEFYVDSGVIWGGTGWETLAAGRPLLQAFNFGPGEYEAEFGHAPPPMLPARSPAEVAAQIAEVYDSPDKGRTMGRNAAAWFDEHGGIGLAKRWLALLEDKQEAAA